VGAAGSRCRLESSIQNGRCHLGIELKRLVSEAVRSTATAQSPEPGDWFLYNKALVIA